MSITVGARRRPHHNGTPPSERSGGRNRVRPAPQFPSGRALVGAALIVIAAAGVLAAHRSASQPATTRYVVAVQDLPAGHTVTAADLGTLAADLPTGVPAVPADGADSLVGRVSRTALSERDLVRPGDLYQRGRFVQPGSVEVPVELDAARALPGALESGSRVDVLSTDPEAEGTVVLARSVLVVDAGDDGAATGIGPSGGVRLRLAVPDQDTATAVVDAAVRSQLTLVLPAPARPDPSREPGDG